MTRGWICAALAALALPGCSGKDLPVMATKKWDNVANRLDTGVTAPLRSMDDVQRFVNRIPYMTDAENYGTDVYWAPPREFFTRGRGDCEDYAIAKYALGLENALFRPEDAKLVAALDLDAGARPHMFLVVKGRVYDNQIRRPFALNSPEAERYAMIGVVDTSGRAVH